MRKFSKTFSDILTIEHRWPKKGDRLLGSSDDCLMPAMFCTEPSAAGRLYPGWIHDGRSGAH
jgi:hypothetical protein